MFRFLQPLTRGLTDISNVESSLIDGAAAFSAHEVSQDAYKCERAIRVNSTNVRGARNGYFVLIQCLFFSITFISDRSRYVDYQGIRTMHERWNRQIKTRSGYSAEPFAIRSQMNFQLNSDCDRRHEIMRAKIKAFQLASSDCKLEIFVNEVRGAGNRRIEMRKNIQYKNNQIVRLTARTCRNISRLISICLILKNRNNLFEKSYFS